MKDFPDGKHKKMEKYILRKAFDVVDDPYLPEEVLWRQKEQFSDGVGYSWVDGLRDHAESVGILIFSSCRGAILSRNLRQYMQCVCNIVHSLSAAKLSYAIDALNIADL